MSDATVIAELEGGVATLTLDRPERRNALVPEVFAEFDAAFATALADDAVKVVRLRGSGPDFCAGYDIGWAAELMAGAAGTWDPISDFGELSRFVSTYTALWRSPKPVIAQVQGACVGGGSDLALCADLVVCAEDARIGYPPARVWGAPTTAMWFYRVGLERAKRLLLTGDPVDGRTAVDWGLASSAHAEDELDEAALALCERVARLPSDQLRISKLLVNTAVEQMGLGTVQTLGGLLDGIARHSPVGADFSRRASADLAAALRERDEPFGDYGSGPRTVTSPLIDGSRPTDEEEG